MENESKLKIGITIGDFNGIGPEVIIKALSDNRVFKLCTPVIYGSTRLLSYYKKALDNEQFNYSSVREPGKFNPKSANVVNCWEDEFQIEPGKPSQKSGECAIISLERATDDLENGVIDALVTAPINKANTQSERFPYPGHTEFFSDRFKNEDTLMLMTSSNIRVGVVTGHIPVSEISSKITKELVSRKIRILHRSLRQDFGISRPRIAVLGLNPHAGDGGLFGNEEIDLIRPAIDDTLEKKALVYGPYPADGFFGNRQYKSFDGILAMYHDQGLIPFKTIAFGEGINFTAGMRVIRTSPDHGTAFDIAGKNQADHASIRSAIFECIDIARNRTNVGKSSAAKQEA